MGTITRISGPLVEARDLNEAFMYELVKVGEMGLFGEIIEMRSGIVSIQVYEDTETLKPGEQVSCTGVPLSALLGPGLIGSIYDGLQRPLPVLQSKYGDFVARGVIEPALDQSRKWDFVATKTEGQVGEGDIVGTVQETDIVVHKIMVPAGIKGRLEGIKSGKYTITEPIGYIIDGEKRHELKLAQTWPVRISRPVQKRLPPKDPMVTGQRVLDMLFPIAKGGTACVPGPFGSGKTVVQHQLAKWADADIIVYVGCGERGNEMTDVLDEFPKLVDPKTGAPLMNRTVLIANTSNMPVAAREASVFLGATIAQYFRDMGYSVAMMADSTSRWAEAMREISGRLEEMPGEEGFPAYLASRIAGFYERAGQTECVGTPERKGTLSIIGAVSPPGGDLSEPVVQATLRAVKVFWALDSQLAYRRHFPAINWLNSYSLYASEVGPSFDRSVGEGWTKYRQRAMTILDEEARLEEIVRLVGQDALSPKQRLTLEFARSIREDFLQQNAFVAEDTYTSPQKQLMLLTAICELYDGAAGIIETQEQYSALLSNPVREKISRAKMTPEPADGFFAGLMKEIEQALAQIGGMQ